MEGIKMPRGREITLQNTKSPCIKCTYRKVGCHGLCEKYKIFKEEIERKKKHKDEYFKKNYDVNNLKIDNIIKWRKSN